jgi:hypothetical protein
MAGAWGSGMVIVGPSTIIVSLPQVGEVPSGGREAWRLAISSPHAAFALRSPLGASLRGHSDGLIINWRGHGRVDVFPPQIEAGRAKAHQCRATGPLWVMIAVSMLWQRVAPPPCTGEGAGEGAAAAMVGAAAVAAAAQAAAAAAAAPWCPDGQRAFRSGRGTGGPPSCPRHQRRHRLVSASDGCSWPGERAPDGFARCGADL